MTSRFPLFDADWFHVEVQFAHFTQSTSWLAVVTSSFLAPLESQSGFLLLPPCRLLGGIVSIFWDHCCVVGANSKMLPSWSSMPTLCSKPSWIKWNIAFRIWSCPDRYLRCVRIDSTTGSCAVYITFCYGFAWFFAYPHIYHTCSSSPSIFSFEFLQIVTYPETPNSFSTSGIILIPS
jgi:hypothetical protein